MFAINKPHARVGNAREQQSNSVQRVGGRNHTAIKHISAPSDLQTAKSQQAVQQLIQQRGLDSDAGLVAQEAVIAFSYLNQNALLPDYVWDPSELAVRALELSDLLATGSTFRTLQMLKRHPALLQLHPDEVSHVAVSNRNVSQGWFDKQYSRYSLICSDSAQQQKQHATLLCCQNLQHISCKVRHPSCGRLSMGRDCALRMLIMYGAG